MITLNDLKKKLAQLLGLYIFVGITFFLAYWALMWIPASWPQKMQDAWSLIISGIVGGAVYSVFEKTFTNTEKKPQTDT
jgi:putative flippase GtrA